MSIIPTDSTTVISYSGFTDVLGCKERNACKNLPVVSTLNFNFLSRKKFFCFISFSSFIHESTHINCLHVFHLKHDT